MNSSLFEQKPWARSQDVVADRPAGMLGPTEAALLYYLARDYYTGLGAIIDAGSFIGASSYCLAKGFAENGGVPDKSARLHAYDLFEVSQDTTFRLTPAELKRRYGIAVADGGSTLPVYLANVGALARHIEVHRGDITEMRWGDRPIEILFLDICKNRKILRHVLRMFYPSLIPGVSVVVHQDYHHPLLPFIHVAQEFLADHFAILDAKADDSATFLATARIPDAALDRACAYDFTPEEEIGLMDRAIARFGAQAEHLQIAKCQLLRQHGRIGPARALLDSLKAEAAAIKRDPRIATHIGFVEHLLVGDECRSQVPPRDYDEAAYLAANPDVAAAVQAGRFVSGFHHWLQFGRNEPARRLN